jgi:hypothetical protein
MRCPPDRLIANEGTSFFTEPRLNVVGRPAVWIVRYAIRPQSYRIVAGPKHLDFTSRRDELALLAITKRYGGRVELCWPRAFEWA